MPGVHAMGRFHFGLVCALLTCAVLAQGQDLAITHVTVIDTRTGRAQRDMTVLISGDHIAAVAESRRLQPPRGAQTVDGQRKFLIPGLWDMHVHMRANWDRAAIDAAAWTFYAPNFIANGVTGVRGMWDMLPTIQKLRAEIASGRVAGPRVVASGNMLDGDPPSVPGAIACADARQGRAAVDQLKREGSDFVKVYSGLSRDTYFAIADQSRKAGLPFAGHVPNSVTAAEASDAGQKSIEHLLGVFVSCSSREAEFAGSVANFGAPLRAAAESYDSRKAAALFARFVKNGTWQTPTLAALRSVAYFGDAAYMKDDRLSQLPPAILEFWKAGGMGMRAADDPAARSRQFERELTLVGAMQKAGVKILAGTDTPNPYVFPGSSLHDELELLVKAGLTPLQALQAATLRPAEYLGMAARLGTIAPGRLADLVLLSGDPLADIANTRRIEAVIQNGRLYQRPDLQRVLWRP
jgi:imidazolonepropionase-like amidohydrolase